MREGTFLVAYQPCSTIRRIASKREALGAARASPAVKAVKQRPKDLNTYLLSHRWNCRGVWSDHWVGYRQRLQNGDLEHKLATVLCEDGAVKFAEQVRLTPQVSPNWQSCSGRRLRLKREPSRVPRNAPGYLDPPFLLSASSD